MPNVQDTLDEYVPDLMFSRGVATELATKLLKPPLMVPVMVAFNTGTGLAHAPPTRTVAELPELNCPELKEKNEPMYVYANGASSA